MNLQRLAYLGALRALPRRPGTISGEGLKPDGEAALLDILRRHRCAGGVYRRFSQTALQASYVFGEARPGQPVLQDTVFRVASISKMITAACCMKLTEAGVLRLDDDVNMLLPYKIRHPLAPGRPMTLRMLLSHTSGIQDGKAYHQGLQNGAKASDILAGDSYADSLPGEAWRYSNFAAGLIACLMEAATGLGFEKVMQQELFLPLNIEATFYPQRVTGLLADARRLIPPRRKPNFNAQWRQRQPMPDSDAPNPQQRYNLAQGNCCVSAAGLQTLLTALMKPGHLTSDSLALMRSPQAGFGKRAKSLSQGLGLFILDDPRLADATVYGHQGNAYGAVHAAFFTPDSGLGFVFLSAGASEARREFLADIVEDLIAFTFKRHHV